MTSSPFNIVIAGGGTGGHIFPALAVADAFVKRYPQGTLLFVGAKGGMETRLIPEHGYPLEVLRVGALKGATLQTRLKTISTLPIAVLHAMSLLQRHRPHVTVGVGGYASAPVVIASFLLRIPVVLLEQNAIPGWTNRKLAHFAKRIVTSFPEAESYFPQGKTVRLGNPMRASLLTLREELQRSRTARPEFTVLVLGGSQGAHAINQVVFDATPELLAKIPTMRIVHQTGENDFSAAQSCYRDYRDRVEAFPFISDMSGAYRRADLVLSRSGATTIAELTLLGIPSLLVPFPHAADDHQTANARFLADHGAALTIAQDRFTMSWLIEQLSDLSANESRRTEMAARALELGQPDAATTIIELVDTLVANVAQRSVLPDEGNHP